MKQCYTAALIITTNTFYKSSVRTQKMNKKALILSLTLAFTLAGCATAPPKQPNDLCKIFEEKPDWYFDAKDAQDKWGSPKHVLMSMMYQESSFKHDAAPPMEYFLWIIPTGRASSAYGYSQIGRAHV